MKETLNNLKNSDRVKSVLIQDTINNTRSFTFTITKKPANFMTKESSLAGREKYVSNIFLSILHIFKKLHFAIR